MLKKATQFIGHLSMLQLLPKAGAAVGGDGDDAPLLQQCVLLPM